MMANNGSAEAKPPRNQAHHTDGPLLQRDDSSTNRSPPHLRIAYSADRARKRSSQMHTMPSYAPVQDGACGMLDRTIQAQIGRMLRDVFADVAAEPVPDRFVTLLAALDAKEKHRGE